MHNLLEPSPTNLMMIITTMPTPFLILELTLVHSPILVRVVEPHGLNTAYPVPFSSTIPLRTLLSCFSPYPCHLVLSCFVSVHPNSFARTIHRFFCTITIDDC
jgi:hypothetical protein